MSTKQRYANVRQAYASVREAYASVRQAYASLRRAIRNSTQRQGIFAYCCVGMAYSCVDLRRLAFSSSTQRVRQKIKHV